MPTASPDGHGYNIDEPFQGKTMLIRIVSMLTKLGRRNHEVRENPVPYGNFDYDNDNDNE
jgi:hypothetical protein